MTTRPVKSVTRRIPQPPILLREEERGLSTAARRALQILQVAASLGLAWFLGTTIGSF